jgi:hypothetical protein
VRKPQVLLLGAAAAAAALTLTAVPASASVAHPAAGTKASGHATTARPQEESSATCDDANWGNEAGLFGIAPGSGNRGGVSGSLWVTAEPYNVTKAEAGSSSDSQQWCELDFPDTRGGSALASLVNGTWFCLTVPNGQLFDGADVYSSPCVFTSEPNYYQEWYVCPRGDDSYSFKAAYADGSALWLTVSPRIAAGNNLTIEEGNAANDQAFTPYESYTGHETLEALAANSC